MSTPVHRYQFASDNYAGVCPEAWQAMASANLGYSSSYGDDPWTDRACTRLRELFETDCEVFFVFTGTAANSLALASLCHSYHSIICHEMSHLETDECGAPEFFSNGTKVLLVPGADGKVDLEAVEHLVHKRSDIHYPKPRVLSVTQTTELGTVYSVDELRDAGELAHRLGLRLHMDGSRFANAVATLNVPPREITWQAGVDVLCFGGAKNGMALGEAVVFFDRKLAVEFDYRCKQAGQLASKMRFLTAPWAGMLEDGAWLRHAGHANRCARMIAQAATALPGVRVKYPCQANSVFLDLPPAMVEGLRLRGWHFYTFIGSGGARFMCSWETREEDVEALVADLTELTRESR
jgi:threonine aldolase